jgi:hypothetical protein
MFKCCRRKHQLEFNEDLLGAVEMSDAEADPYLLDISSESFGSSRIARIQFDLASLAVSPTEVGATQMAADQHQQQAKVSRKSESQGTVEGALEGASHNETSGSHGCLRLGPLGKWSPPPVE